MSFIAYPLVLIVGISLGLIGAGGSILTVPILVYLFKLPTNQATAYSLFVVGLTALVGSYRFWKQDLVDLKTAFSFGIPSFFGVYLTRLFVVPRIPAVVYESPSLKITGGDFVMFIFALVMIFAARSMIRKSPPVIEPESKGAKESIEPKKNPATSRRKGMIFVDGLLVGALTGFVGAGGGFLVIPALVKLAGVPMKIAIGTSLLIIAMKSLFGFIGDIQTQPNIDWTFLFTISAIAIVGIFVGIRLSRNIPGKKLEPAFGWFVLAMGVFIISRELLR